MNSGVATALTPRVLPQEQSVIDVLEAAGFQLKEAWFYPPGGESRALIRITVYGGQYQIWRRPRVRAPWMLIVTADVEEFQVEAFSTWRQTWPLSC